MPAVKNRKIVINPVTRIEGHAKVTIHLDDDGNVAQTRLHIVEFRGFERFVQGRPYWEMPVLVQRLCGICPVSHHLAAAKALDVIVGAGTGDGLHCHGRGTSTAAAATQAPRCPTVAGGVSESRRCRSPRITQ